MKTLAIVALCASLSGCTIVGGLVGGSAAAAYNAGVDDTANRQRLRVDVSRPSHRSVGGGIACGMAVGGLIDLVLLMAIASSVGPYVP